MHHFFNYMLDETAPGQKLLPTMERLLPAKSTKNTIARHLREVRFVHRAVIDFLDEEYPDLVRDSYQSSAMNLALIRGKLGLMSIDPSNIPKTDFASAQDLLGRLIICVMDRLMLIPQISTIESTEAHDEHAGNEMVHHAHQVISHVNVDLYGPSFHWSERYKGFHFAASWVERLPFNDYPGFAAFLGCREYIVCHTRSKTCPPMELKYLLACTIIGSKQRVYKLNSQRLRGHFKILHELLHQEVDTNLYLYSYGVATFNHVYNISAWGEFLKTTIPFIAHLWLQPSENHVMAYDGTPKHLLSLVSS